MKHKKLREHLAKLAGNPAELAKALPAAMQAFAPTTVLDMRAPGGGALTAEARAELLARAVAKEEVVLEVDILAYEQKTGERNRNNVRFRDGAMMSLGRSGKGTPFLKNHDQWDVESRGGTIISSATEKRAEGDYVIRQTARLTAPWAVELVLRGLMDSTSIGWRPTGPVMCSVCNTEIFTQCWHCPGDDLTEGEATALKVDPSTIVEWIYSEGELKETSGVNVPGVASSRIDGVRASLEAYLGEHHQLPRSAFAGHEGNFRFGDNPEETHDMDPKLIALLGLAATATPSEVLAAVEAMKTAESADKAELAIKTSELTKHAAAIATLQASERKRNEDKFVSDALSSGRIALGDEAQWRALYEVDQERATKLMAERPANATTPVGAPRASENDPDRAPVITGGTRRMSQVKRSLARLTEQLVKDPQAASFAVNAFGFGDPLNRLRNVPETLGATTIVNDAAAQTARIGFHAAFLEQIDTTDDMMGIGQIYTEVSSNRRLEQHDWMGDLPDMEEWTSGRKLSGLEAFSLSVLNKKWSNGIRVKNDDFKDDNLGLLPPQVAQLAIRAKMHRFTMMVKMLQNGFDGTTYPEVGDGLSYDGAFYFSTAHRGGTSGANGTNKLTVVLNSANLATAEQMLRQQRTYDGALPYGSKGTHLIVGPQNEATAEKLMTSDYLANAAGTATETNYQKNKYKIIVADQIDLVHPLDWFLVDLSGPIKPMLFQLREEISTSAIMGGQGTNNDSVPRFSYDEIWFGAEARYNAAYFEFRRCVGSRSA